MKTILCVQINYIFTFPVLQKHYKILVNEVFSVIYPLRRRNPIAQYCSLSLNSSSFPTMIPAILWRSISRNPQFDRKRSNCLLSKRNSEKPGVGLFQLSAGFANLVILGL
jgi:hypothetical protein